MDSGEKTLTASLYPSGFRMADSNFYSLSVASDNRLYYTLCSHNIDTHARVYEGGGKASCRSFIAAEDRVKLAKELALKKAPKQVTINIIKAPDVSLNMDRLDGFQAELVGPNGRFTSAPILTSGNRGSCKFAAGIPPGDYRLNMSIFKLSVEIKVPEKPASSLSFDMNITSRGINITEKE